MAVPGSFFHMHRVDGTRHNFKSSGLVADYRNTTVRTPYKNSGKLICGAKKLSTLLTMGGQIDPSILYCYNSVGSSTPNQNIVGMEPIWIYVICSKAFI